MLRRSKYDRIDEEEKGRKKRIQFSDGFRDERQAE